MKSSSDSLQESPQTASTDGLDSAEAVYAAWRSAMESLDVDRVVALYHEQDAGFWGTLAGKWKHGRQAIRPYFEWFLDRASIAIDPREIEYREVAPGIVISGGTNLFTLGGKTASDPCDEVMGRLTFVFRRDEATGTWCIVEHHSSVMPASPAPLP